MNRVLRAATALLFVALIVPVAGDPAAAAPVVPVADGCSVAEWASPIHIPRCTAMKAAELGRKMDCIKAPIPSSPDAGVAGWFASRPESSLRPGVAGRYSRYGVGGYRTALYDMGCAGAVPVIGAAADPGANAANGIANASFAGAAAFVGTANSWREQAYKPGGAWGWADPMVEAVTKKVHEQVFTPLGAIALAGVGIYLLMRAKKGNLGDAVTIGGWALLVMVVVTAIVRWPVTTTHIADKAAAETLTVVHSAVGPSPENIPADKCTAPSLDWCADHRSVAVRASDTAAEAILYRNWLRAVLGSADSATARKYGPALFDAAALTWDEAARIEQNPGERAGILQAKAGQWMTIAKAVETEDPAAYEYLQGKHGTDRVMAGVMAALSAAVYAVFDLVASLLILLCYLVFRVAVVAAPLLGTVGLFYPASAAIRKLANRALTAAVGVVVIGAGAGLYLNVAGRVFATSMVDPMKIAAVFCVGAAICWLIRFPIRASKIDGWANSDKKAIPAHIRGDLSYAARHIVDMAAPVVAPGVPIPKLAKPAAPVRPETTAGSRQS
ncbi:MAG TPA: MFS transporter [Micromonosporaceae bacterium]|nr:MFS transporter [Micromonosporaceae bacterium]